MVKEPLVYYSRYGSKSVFDSRRNKIKFCYKLGMLSIFYLLTILKLYQKKYFGFKLGKKRI
jgi:hypothetical protein